MEPVNYFVVSFFAVATTLVAYIAARLRSTGKQPMQDLGTGLYFTAAAFLVWTYITWAHPVDMKTITALGAVPFMAAFVFYIKAAANGVKPASRSFLYLVSGALLAVFVFIRFFMFTSDPGFTGNGYFAFNIDPVVLYFYAMITSFTFIPAVYVVGRHIKHDMTRVCFELGLTLTAIGMVIMVTGSNENLQFVNGVGIMFGLLAAAGALASRNFDKSVK